VSCTTAVIGVDGTRRAGFFRACAFSPSGRTLTGVARSLEPVAVWAAVERGEGRILDLRTGVERRRYGAPPGAKAVSLARHIARPEGPGAIYLCQHAVRSKATLRRGAAEVAGGFVAWRKAGLAGGFRFAPAYRAGALRCSGAMRERSST
jgi:rhodanese-related sulfurtransferase